jgi:glycosyltransferase involved in cell wall biosynthesis
LRVVVVSGIWPPDVGGPATHAPEVAEYLLSRGHSVEVVTTAAAPPAPAPYPVHWVPRRIPMGVRHLAVAGMVHRVGRRADVVYSTGMVGRSSLGATIGRVPLVLKLTSDPTYERSIRYRFYKSDLDSFQHARDPRIRALRLARDLELKAAARIVIPSESLRDIAVGWGVPREKVEVLPNPVVTPELPPRDELRARHGLEGKTLVFAGRLSVQKAVGVALEALTRLDGVSLILAGDGPDAELLRRQASELSLDGRARFLGPQPRAHVLELLKAADAVVLSSAWENFPHVLVEALGVGTPVISTSTGGVTEIVRDGENGLLVPPGNPEALAAAVRRYFGDPELEARLRAAARGSVTRFAPERIYGRLEEILQSAAR